jgi:hypothetical protein
MSSFSEVCLVPIEASRLWETKQNTMNINCIHPNQDPHVAKRAKRWNAISLLRRRVWLVSRKIGWCRKFMKNLIVPSSKTRRSPFFLASLSWVFCSCYLVAYKRARGTEEITIFVKHPSCLAWKRHYNDFMCFFGNSFLKFSFKFERAISSDTDLGEKSLRSFPEFSFFYLW